MQYLSVGLHLCCFLLQVGEMMVREKWLFLTIKNCGLYADHTGQGVRCSFAATFDVMNVRSSSVNRQFGEMCLVFPRLICRSACTVGFI